MLIFHREVFCYRCTKFDAYTSVQKILEDDCTRFHDVKYRCKKGFHLNEHKDCVACPLGKVVKDGKCVDPSVDFQEPGESLEPKQKDGILERRPNGCETHHDNGTYNQTKGDNASLDDADMQMSIGMFIGIIFAVLTVGFFVGGFFFPTVIKDCICKFFWTFLQQVLSCSKRYYPVVQNEVLTPNELIELH